MNLAASRPSFVQPLWQWCRFPGTTVTSSTPWGPCLPTFRNCEPLNSHGPVSWFLSADKETEGQGGPLLVLAGPCFPLRIAGRKDEIPGIPYLTGVSGPIRTIRAPANHVLIT